MAFKFRCPICNSERKATENIIGRRVRCADCNNFVEVPRPDDSQAKPDDASGDASDQVTRVDGDDFEPNSSVDIEQIGVFNLGAPIENLPSDESASGAVDGQDSRSSEMDSDQSSSVEDADAQRKKREKDRDRKDIIVRWKEEPDEYDSGSTKVDFKADREDNEAEMDMTPMVDVTFLLLIFFMVTASFTMQKTIEQGLQKDDQPSTNVKLEDFEDDPDFITVLVDEFDTYRVITNEWDEEAPSEQDLIIRLRRAREGDSNGNIPKKLLVTAHGDASHGKVVTAMDAGREVGIVQIQVVLTEESLD